jgi:hypothetical protein
MEIYTIAVGEDKPDTWCWTTRYGEQLMINKEGIVAIEPKTVKFA